MGGPGALLDPSLGLLGCMSPSWPVRSLLRTVHYAYTEILYSHQRKSL